MSFSLTPLHVPKENSNTGTRDMEDVEFTEAFPEKWTWVLHQAPEDFLKSSHSITAPPFQQELPLPLVGSKTLPWKSLLSSVFLSLPTSPQKPFGFHILLCKMEGVPLNNTEVQLANCRSQGNLGSLTSSNNITIILFTLEIKS